MVPPILIEDARQKHLATAEVLRQVLTTDKHYVDLDPTFRDELIAAYTCCDKPRMAELICDAQMQLDAEELFESLNDPTRNTLPDDADGIVRNFKMGFLSDIFNDALAASGLKDPGKQYSKLIDFEFEIFDGEPALIKSFRVVSRFSGGIAALRATNPKDWPRLAETFVREWKESGQSSELLTESEGIARCYRRFVNLTEDEVRNLTNDDLLEKITLNERIPKSVKMALRSGLVWLKDHTNFVSELKARQGKSSNYELVLDVLGDSSYSERQKLITLQKYGIFIIGLGAGSIPYVLAHLFIEQLRDGDIPATAGVYTLTALVGWFGASRLIKTIPHQIPLHEPNSAALVFGGGVLANTVTVVLADTDMDARTDKRFIGQHIFNPTRPIQIARLPKNSKQSDWDDLAGTIRHEDIHRIFKLLGCDEKPIDIINAFNKEQDFPVYFRHLLIQIIHSKDEIIARANDRKNRNIVEIATAVLDRTLYSEFLAKYLPQDHPLWRRFEAFIVEAVNAALVLRDLPDGHELLMATSITKWPELVLDKIQRGDFDDLAGIKMYRSPDFDSNAVPRLRLLKAAFWDISAPDFYYQPEIHRLLVELIYRRRNNQALNAYELALLWEFEDLLKIQSQTMSNHKTQPQIVNLTVTRPYTRAEMRAINRVRVSFFLSEE